MPDPEDKTFIKFDKETATKWALSALFGVLVTSETVLFSLAFNLSSNVVRLESQINNMDKNIGAQWGKIAEYNKRSYELDVRCSVLEKLEEFKIVNRIEVKKDRTSEPILSKVEETELRKKAEKIFKEMSSEVEGLRKKEKIDPEKFKQDSIMQYQQRQDTINIAGRRRK